MRVRACVRECVCVWGGARARACAFARVALLIRHEKGIRHIVCDLSGSTTFFDIIS
jgi:hypothetical protein